MVGTKVQRTEEDTLAKQWWCTPLTSVLGEQRQVDPYKSEASLVYNKSSRRDKATQRSSVTLLAVWQLQIMGVKLHVLLLMITMDDGVWSARRHVSR